LRATAPEALLSSHVALLGETLDPFLMFPMFPNLVFIVIIRSTWVVRFGGIPHYKLLEDIFILNEVSGMESWEMIAPTFLFFLPAPVLRFVFPRKPLTSSSNTIDGGLTFFPHPDLWLEPGPGTGIGSGMADVDTSTRVGGAATMAVAEIVVGGALIMPTWENAASAATFVGLLADGLGLRLTGAKARDADHPSD